MGQDHPGDYWVLTKLRRRRRRPRDVGAATASLVLHSAGGLVILLFTTVLGVYKPRGMTRYGLRRAVRS
jgi:hypothetical protein